MRVIEHEECYELCDWGGDVHEACDTLKGLKGKPIRFTLDPANVEASKFYRKLLELGKVRLHRFVFEVVK